MTTNTNMAFFYDAQIRRILVQFMRVFSLIKIQTGPDESGTFTESNVPIRYGDLSRMVAAILKENSESTVVSSNLMTASILSIDMAPERRQNPFHVSNINMDEREFVNGAYTSEIGDQLTIQRYMPVPYNLKLQLDIWTSNTNTKMQILEQIMTIFNPSIQIQQHDNMLDWSVMTEVELTEVNWTNRSISQGTESERDIATLTFNVPIWINPPAKVSKKTLIKEIVTNVFNVAEIDKNDVFVLDEYTNCFTRFDQFIVTPGNYQIKIGIDDVATNEIMLLNEFGGEDPSLSWATLFELYGQFNSGSSTVILKTNDNIEESDGDIYGFIEIDPDRPNVLLFDVNTDTLPETIDSGAIDKIINPNTVYPGNNLPVAAVGQRYLLLEDIPVNTGLNPWGAVFGKENDIIEYNGTDWFVSFNSSVEADNQYVKSLSSYQHYKFINGSWVHTYFGNYNPGHWKIVL